MLAAILVGGKGTRLHSIVNDRPKPLATVAGEPFLYLLLREIKSAGIGRVLLLTSFLHEKFIEACADGRQFGLKIDYSREMTPLGTAGALKNAESILTKEKEFLLLNGDTYSPQAVAQILAAPALKPTEMGIIGITRVTEAQRYGALSFTEQLHLTGFREKTDQGPGFINAGIYRLSPDILRLIPSVTCYSLEQELLPGLLAQGCSLRVCHLPGEMCDIGTPESYLNFNALQS